MIRWQQECIGRNIYGLMHSTNCSVALAAFLKTNNVIHDSETDQLTNSTVPNGSRAYRMYDLLKTRVGAYEVLKSALAETCQSGALQILHDAESGRDTYLQYEKLQYFEEDILQRLQPSMLICKGKFGTRIAMVKVIDNFNDELMKSVKTELDLLIDCDWHDNIVRCFIGKLVPKQHQFITGECFAMAFEYGMSLDKYDVTEDAKRIICADILQGVKFLHSRRILHLNLKPESIYVLSFDGTTLRAKIGDFLHAKILNAQDVVEANLSDIYEQAAGNTPEVLKEMAKFHSPKEFKETTVKMSVSTDAFCLGLTLYYCLSGRRHAFGNMFTRNFNLFHDQPQVDENHVLIMSDFGRNTFLKLISCIPEERPDLTQIDECEIFTLRNNLKCN